MSTYTVKAINSTRNWKSKYGDMVSYKCVLVNETGNVAEVEVSQKVSTAPPHVGQAIAGTVEKTDYGLKFKKEQQQGGGFRGGGRQHSPEDRRSIERQVAAKCATELVAAGKVNLGELKLTIDTIAAGIAGE